MFMKRGFNILGILVYSIILLFGYHYALNRFAGKHFKAFNYDVVITRCGPTMNDRIDKIEKQVKKVENQ